MEECYNLRMPEHRSDPQDVIPSLSGLSELVSPRASSSLTTPSCPLKEAHWSGVVP